MVLKPRAHARSQSQESKRSLPLKIVRNDKSPERLLKEGRKLKQEERSRSTSRRSRSNSRSTHRCATYYSSNSRHSPPNPRHTSPTAIPILPSLSRNLYWDPYEMASVITDKGKLKVLPYQDSPYANSKTPSDSNFSGYKKYFSPVKYHIPNIHVRDDPVQTKRKSIVEFADQTTMTPTHSRAGSSVGSVSRHTVPALRYSDMFLSPSMLRVREKQRQYDVFRYSAYEPDKNPLHRTSSYFEPVATNQSFYKYYLPPSCLKPPQNSDTSIYSNQVTPKQPCVCEKKKVLYNEGIFECETYRPKRRMLKTPPSTPIRGKSWNRDYDKSNIPLYNSESKYQICRKPSSRVLTDFQPTTCHQQVVSGPKKQSKGIALPKRMLQSELDIDQFLCTAPDIFVAKNECIQRPTCPHKFFSEL